MKNSCYSTFFSCLFLCFISHSQTIEKEYSFKTITTEDGLSNNIIYDVLQDKAGYIWIATDNGLNRYDGYNTKTFFHKATDSSSISSGVVRSLIEDLDGKIWIGTRNGLNLYDKEAQGFKQLIDPQESPFLNQEVMKMTLGNDGRIWMTLLNDIGVFNPKTLRFQLVYRSDSSPYMHVANDKVWIQNKEGALSYYDINSNTLIHVFKDSSFVGKTIHYGAQSKQLWIPAEFQAKIDVTNYRFLPDLPNNLSPINFLEIDANTLWIGTEEGLYEYDHGLKETKKIYLAQSTLVQQIRSLYKDNHNGIWVGTLGGIFHFDPHRKMFRHIDLDMDFDDIVMGMHAVKNGIYANALGKGVYYKSFSSDEPKKLKLPKSFPRQGLFIWDIEEVFENDFPVWMATNSGLLCYDPVTSSFQKVEIPVTDKNEEISFSILNTKHDYLWVSTHNAIHQISKKEGELRSSFSLTEFTEYHSIQKIIALGNYIFIATEGQGLLSFHVKTREISKINISMQNGESQPFKTSIWDLYTNKDSLWIGTNQGLYTLTLKSMEIKPEFLDDQIIFSIIQDDRGILWMGSDKGIKAYNPSNQLIRYYSIDQGVKNKEFNRKSVVRSANGYLWFGGVNGITSFDPVKIKKDNPNKPYVYITELKVITPDSSFVVPHIKKKVVLPWKHNTIEVKYVGLNYTNPSQNKYKYQMEGYDPSWVRMNKPDRARYIRLPVGNHTFNVTAANNDNIWNTHGKTIEIKVLPPIWRTKAAYILYVLALVGIINLMRRLKRYRNRIKEVEREKDEIAKKVEEIAVILNNKSKVYLDKLKYIKSDGNYLEFVTDDKTIIDRNKLKDVLDCLPPNFVRTHRSYIVNKNQIESFNSKTVFLASGHKIPLSRTFKSNIT